MTKDEALAIINRLQECIEHDSCEKMNCLYFNTFEDLKGLAEWLEIKQDNVCCKDCRYHDKGSNEVDSWNRCLLWKADVYDEFYCRNGEIFDGKGWEGK